ncbi:MAG: glutamate formimidoyltransferase [Deltaproteobacteria bacterium]|nr:glutamate formimidoyltransferase [Deltaproteobacteria bacterium]
MKIIECVPNFSEGRDKALIRQITDVISSVDGVTLKDVDPGADTNRTVVTFLGSPEGVLEAAFRAIRKAAELIDMRSHKGAHPRMGATDVCPFVPVNDATMEECAELARRLGKRVGEELCIPVYLYEHAATRPERRSLAVLRKGEYEGLGRKLADPTWRPDFGPSELNARSGATVIGAREFLIAYNINLNTTSRDAANDIALELREKGRSFRVGNTRPYYYRGEQVKHETGLLRCGSCDSAFEAAEGLFLHTQSAHGYDVKALIELNDQDPANLPGQFVLRPGLFSHCRALGWEVPEYGRAQISINLTHYQVTPPHIVLEKARELALARGLIVTGSEIVGLVPLDAMLAAGRYYLEKQGRSTGVPQDDVLTMAVQSMGLKDVAPFEVADKVIGYTKTGPKALISKRTDEFVHEVSRSSPAPGGGSVAALAGALGSALASMVANLTIGKAGYQAVESTMRAIAVGAQIEKDALLQGVDADTQAFEAYMTALRMPKNTDEEKATRKAAMQAGLKGAIAVPLDNAKRCRVALAHAAASAKNGLKSSVSDAGVGAHMAMAGAEGAVLNVLINLSGVDDAEYVSRMRAECEELLTECRALLQETQGVVLDRIK